MEGGVNGEVSVLHNRVNDDEPSTGLFTSFFPISLISQFTPIGLGPRGPALSSFLPSRGSSILQSASEGLCRAAALWLLSEGLSAVKCT